MSVLSGLMVVILAAPPIAWSEDPMRGQQGSSGEAWWKCDHNEGAKPEDPENPKENWKQCIVDNRVRFVYLPREFVAGGQTYVKIQDLSKTQDLSNGKLAIEFENIHFPKGEGKISPVAKDGFWVTIPLDAPTDNHQYRIRFRCSESRTCPPDRYYFYMPVKNNRDYPLEVKLHSPRPYIPTLENNSTFQVGLTVRRSIYDVRLKEDPDHKLSGVATIGFVDISGKGNNIDSVHPGNHRTADVEITRGNPFAQLLNHLVSQWRGDPPKLSLTFTFTDEYHRAWEVRSPAWTFEYRLQHLGSVFYYLFLILLATAAGQLTRVVLGTAVAAARTEAKAVLSSYLLALVLCAFGWLVGAKIEPIGLFKFDLTTLTGLLTAAFATGLMPEVIRKGLQALLPRSALTAPPPHPV